MPGQCSEGQVVVQSQVVHDGASRAQGHLRTELCQSYAQRGYTFLLACIISSQRFVVRGWDYPYYLALYKLFKNNI